MPDSTPAFIDFGREVSSELECAEKREWLVTNGLGGFASGTIAGLLTRRYHGLLIAALNPPLGRTLLVAKVDEAAQYAGQTFPLSSNRWAGGVVDPQGFRLLERFRLEGMIPVWTFLLREILLEKRVWMEDGSNTTYVRYDLARGAGPVDLYAKALVNYRDYHATTHADGWQMQIEKVPQGIRVNAFRNATPLYLLSSVAEAEPAHDWYRNYELSVERARGLDDIEDHLHAATFHARIMPDRPLTLVFSTNPDAHLDGTEALNRRREFEQNLLRQFSIARSCPSQETPPGVLQLVLAADQFIVRRDLPGDADARSVIAGYHWFGDWGRDTMVSLAGLLLVTGRSEVARKVLLAFSRFVDGGMLPNCFPDGNGSPLYNTVDAALWYVEAARQYFESTRDLELIRSLFPALDGIFHSYMKGTRYNIHADSSDGLLYAGAEGIQLTWMDAKVGDWVVTPRIGKPIEVNALWLNALASMAHFAQALGKPSADYQKAFDQVRTSFARYWNQRLGYCYDVLDGPSGNDVSLRPNQIFAVSLRESALSPEQQRAVVDVCARQLLTSFGLRSLAPSSDGYRGRYAGGPQERDAAYHQGTAWGWLLGPFALAHWRVYRDRRMALSFLDPMRHHLQTAGLGTASEIFNGDPPFEPSGAIAQAWTVAEVLRAWSTLATA